MKIAEMNRRDVIRLVLDICYSFEVPMQTALRVALIMDKGIFESDDEFTPPARGEAGGPHD